MNKSIANDLSLLVLQIENDDSMLDLFNFLTVICSSFTLQLESY